MSSTDNSGKVDVITVNSKIGDSKDENNGESKENKSDETRLLYDAIANIVDSKCGDTR